MMHKLWINRVNKRNKQRMNKMRKKVEKDDLNQDLNSHKMEKYKKINQNQRRRSAVPDMRNK